jgi:hypothetical protein
MRPNTRVAEEDLRRPGTELLRGSDDDIFTPFPARCTGTTYWSFTGQQNETLQSRTYMPSWLDDPKLRQLLASTFDDWSQTKHIPHAYTSISDSGQLIACAEVRHDLEERMTYEDILSLVEGWAEAIVGFSKSFEEWAKSSVSATLVHAPRDAGPIPPAQRVVNQRIQNVAQVTRGHIEEDLRKAMDHDNDGVGLIRPTPELLKQILTELDVHQDAHDGTIVTPSGRFTTCWTVIGERKQILRGSLRTNRSSSWSVSGQTASSSSRGGSPSTTSRATSPTTKALSRPGSHQSR